MRRLACHVCGTDAPFIASQCETCASALGFFPSLGDLRPLRPVTAVSYVTSGSSSPVLRCLNFAWGCNWVLPADAGAVWCESCRLTRGRPDVSSIDAVLAWSTAEATKRRLIFQLHTLQLPIGPPAPGTDDGVVFDLVYLPESRGVTGHRTGVVTIDLREADDRYREATRIQMGEPDRTVLGHLRHEIGHHYWELLVAGSGGIDEFRSLFGDERVDYAGALTDHYAQLGRTVPYTHITSYAAAHPTEDWAETFAHYLHLRDGLETADAFDLDAGHRTSEPTTLASMIQRWRRITTAVNEMSLGLGHVRPYPYTITTPIAAKLAFVHRRLLLATEHRASGATTP